jgi:glycosyltransferase involved in cell wall biosynthesis
VADHRPTVSIVIPVLNGAAHLAQQLEALRRESAQPFETVIADNGSTDDSVAIARSFSGDMTIVVADASAQRGCGCARNAGAKVATGEYLLFLDADDEIGPGYVEAMVSALGSAEFVAASVDDHKLNDPWCREARPISQTNELTCNPLPAALGGTLGVRRSTFERLGGFADEFGAGAGEDVDFCWRAHRDGVVLTLVRDAVLHYRIRSTLRASFRQSRAYGFANVIVRARLGIPFRTRRSVIRSCATSILHIVMGPTKAIRARGVFVVGLQLGHLRALRQLKHGLPALGLASQSPAPTS